MAAFSDWDGSQRCFRTLKLVVEGGGYFMREFLKQKAVQPSGAFSTLDVFLANNKTTIDRLKQRKIIKDAQYDILYPQNNSPTNIEKWDITLASCILINCLNLSQFERKAVDDIRILRNTLHGHSTTMSLTETEFQTHWVDVSTCLTNASLLLTSVRCQNHVSDMIRTIHTESLSPLETIAILKQWLMRDTAVDKKLDDIANRQDTLGDSFDDMKNSFKDIEMYMKQKEAKLKKEQVDQRKLNREIETAKIKIKEHTELLEENEIPPNTRWTQICTEKLRKNNILILTGMPGSGKTFLAFNVLKQILDSDNNIHPLIMDVPSEFKEVLDMSKQLVLFIDDLVGKFSIDNMELNQWNRYVDTLLSFTKTRKLLVIITLRKNIMLKCMNENVEVLFLQKDYIYDLDENQLNRQEKEELISLYANRNDVEINKDELNTAIAQGNYGIGFPFLCTLLKGGYNPDIFLRPVECIKGALLKMRKKDTASFVALLMTLFCDDKLYRSGIDEQSLCFKEICKHFKSSGIDEANMFDAEEALVDTYLKFNATHEHFSFVHDTIAESAFSAARECILNILIRFCPITTLTKLFVIESKEKKNSRMEGRQILYKKLADRFKAEMCSDDLRNAIQCIGSSFLWQNQAFCDTAFDLLDSKDFYREDENHKSLLCYLSCFGDGELIQRIIDTKTSNLQKELNERQAIKSTTEACRFGKVDCFQILISNITEISDEMMFAAIQGGNCPILERLLRKGGNILTRKPDSNESLLHEACAIGEYAIVGTILGICNEEEILELLTSTTSNDQKTPLLYAATKGSVELLQLLLDNGSNIDSKDKDGFNSLHCAAMYGNIDVVKYIFAHHKYLINAKSTKGYTAAHSATAGDITCLSYVLDQGIDSEDVTVDGGTLLHEASINGNVEVVNYICETYGNMMWILDKDQETPCHYAARGGHVDSLAILIAQGVDPNKRSKKGYTAMHEAAFCGKIDILKYLCDNYPGMIHMNDDNEASAAHHAAAGGHLDCLTYLIDQGIDPFIKTNRGFTLLHKASYSGKLDIVKHLCKTYKDMIKVTNSYGGNPAFSAVSGGHTDCLKYIIEQGIDVLESTASGETLLHRACMFGQTDIVKYLSVSHTLLFKMTDENGRTACYSAARGGNLDCLTICVKHGMDPASEFSAGETLLHISSKYGQLDITKYLCEKHASLINSEDNDGRTAYFLAAGQGHLECLKFLTEIGDNQTINIKDGQSILHIASRNGHTDVVNYICKHSLVPVDSTDNDGRTSSLLAAGQGHLECLKFLIEIGDNQMINIKDGQSILHIASRNGRTDVVNYICKQSLVPVDSTDNDGRTAASWAASGGHLECLKILLKFETHPMFKFKGGESLLHAASKFGHLDVAKYLCEKHASLIKCEDNDGRTASFLAAGQGHLECLKFLIEMGDNQMIKIIDGLSILHIASKYGHKDVVKYICKHSLVPVDSTDNDGRTAAYLAAICGRLECLKILLEFETYPKFVFKGGETLLHAASKFGYLEVAKYLCEKHSHLIDRVDNDGRTAAYLTAGGGHLECLQMFIKLGIDPHSKCNRGDTFLHAASRFGHLHVIKYLCECHTFLTNSEDNKGRNSAHLVAARGHFECLTYLIKTGIDPVSKTQTGRTLLHQAAGYGHLQIIKQLIENYPTLIHIEDNAGRTAAFHAASRGHLDCLKSFIELGVDPMLCNAGESLLHAAAKFGNVNVTKYLCKMYPVLIKTKDEHGRTAAYFAAKGDHLECLKYFLQCGIDPEKTTYAGRTLLNTAAFNGSIHVVKYLCEEQRSLLNMLDKDGYNVAHEAALGGHLECLSYLLEQSDKLLTKSNTGRTTLHSAAFTGHENVVKYLCQRYGFMIQVPDRSGQNPAHGSAGKGHLECLKYLIQQGTDPTTPTFKGHNLLHLAAYKGRENVVDFLCKEHTYLITMKDNNGQTAAHLAAAEGHLVCLKILNHRRSDPMAMDKDHSTILHLAAQNGRIKILNYLCETQKQLVQKYRHSAKRLAQYNGQTACVDVLNVVEL